MLPRVKKKKKNVKRVALWLVSPLRKIKIGKKVSSVLKRNDDELKVHAGLNLLTVIHRQRF
mgnify:CR=1 FL=1